MHEEQGVVHIDLKLENILIEEDFTIKLADFGFATSKNIDRLHLYRGTKTYMAPEIKRGEIYKGKQVDIFSIGVIVFILVMGLFPFHEAKEDNYYYNLLLRGNLEKYWQKVGGSSNISPQFKNFIVKFFAAKGSQRITLDQIKSDPWFLQQSSLSDNEIRRNIIN